MNRRPTRRTVLAAVGASAVGAIAGCFDSEPPATESEPTDANHTTDGSNATTTDDPTTTTADRSDRLIERVEADDPSDTTPFQHGVELLAQPTNDHPARLRLSVTNAADSEHTIRTNYRGLPFPSRLGTDADGNATLVLLPASDAQRRDGCRRAQPVKLPTVDTKTLAPDETLSKTYALVNHSNSDSCWPTGDHRFSQRYEVDPDGNAITYDWGFVIWI